MGAFLTKQNKDRYHHMRFPRHFLATDRMHRALSFPGWIFTAGRNSSPRFYRSAGSDRALRHADGDGLLRPTAGSSSACKRGHCASSRMGFCSPTPFVTVATTANGERGLLGVTFDPNFATNQFVYVYYTVPRRRRPTIASAVSPRASRMATSRSRERDGYSRPG